MITLDEICKDLKIGKKTLLSRMKNNGIKTNRIGMKFFISEQDAMILLETNTRKNGIQITQEELDVLIAQGRSINSIAKQIKCSRAGLRDFFYNKRNKEELVKKFNLKRGRKRNENF